VKRTGENKTTGRWRIAWESFGIVVMVTEKSPWWGFWESGTNWLWLSFGRLHVGVYG
jgi:hypothetical protein